MSSNTSSNHHQNILKKIPLLQKVFLFSAKNLKHNIIFGATSSSWAETLFDQKYGTAKTIFNNMHDSEKFVFADKMQRWISDYQPSFKKVKMLLDATSVGLEFVSGGNDNNIHPDYFGTILLHGSIPCARETALLLIAMGAKCSPKQNQVPQDVYDPEGSGEFSYFSNALDLYSYASMQYTDYVRDVGAECHPSQFAKEYEMMMMFARYHRKDHFEEETKPEAIAFYRKEFGGEFPPIAKDDEELKKRYLKWEGEKEKKRKEEMSKTEKLEEEVLRLTEENTKLKEQLLLMSKK
jgi:hypothetical protein